MRRIFAGKRILEFGEQDLDDTGKFMSLGEGEVIEIGTHFRESRCFRESCQAPE